MVHEDAVGIGDDGRVLALFGSEEVGGSGLSRVQGGEAVFGVIPGVAASSSAQCLEAAGVGDDRGRRVQTFRQQVAKSLPASIVAGRFPLRHSSVLGLSPWTYGIDRGVCRAERW